MEVTSLSYLYVLMVTVASKVTRIAGDCIASSKVTHRPFSDTIVNHTLVGPVMSSITAKNERECEMECHLAVPDGCYMFNYHPSSKVCELLYKNRAAEYKVEKKKGSTFKTRKCASSLCLPSQHCVALGNQDNTLCLNFTGHVTKTNTEPVCIENKDNQYGTFVAPADGKIKTFKLVHISGGIAATRPRYGQLGNWGTLKPSDPHPHLELHITDTQNMRITPPPGYPLDNPTTMMRYAVPGGFTVMSPELVFPEISPPLAVTKGKEFRIWGGQDLLDTSEDNNRGRTCADVYVFFSD